MARMLRTLVTASALVAGALGGSPAFAQKSGGILKVHHQDSPASMSIIEEATYSTVVPMMGVFNNLVMYKQDEPQNSMKSIVPDLATSWQRDGDDIWPGHVQLASNKCQDRGRAVWNNRVLRCWPGCPGDAL